MSAADDFADGLIAAHRSGTRFTAAPGFPSTPDDAYAVQQRVAQALGPVAGFKTGRKAGTDQTRAPILASGVLPNGAVLPRAGETGIELEVGFLIVSPPPSPDAADFVARMQACVTPFVAIELVDTRVTGPRGQEPVVKLADNQVNLGLVVGPGPDQWDGRDFGTLTARMTAGDQVLLDGAAEVPCGSAFETLLGLARDLGDHCGGLREGMRVITGSLHPLTYVPAGLQVIGWIDGLGEVSVKLEAAAES